MFAECGSPQPRSGSGRAAHQPAVWELRWQAAFDVPVPWAIVELARSCAYWYVQLWWCVRAALGMNWMLAGDPRWAARRLDRTDAAQVFGELGVWDRYGLLGAVALVLCVGAGAALVGTGGC